MVNSRVRRTPAPPSDLDTSSRAAGQDATGGPESASSGGSGSSGSGSSGGSSSGGSSGLSISLLRASDMQAAAFKILLYGKPGAGKTHASARAPNPVFLLTEANGVQSIRLANPRAAIFQANDAARLREFMKAALSGELRQAGFSTLVVDSLTEVQRLLQDEILRAKTNPADGMTLPDYGLLTERMRGFFRSLRDLDMDVVATALDEETVEEATGEIHVRPAFTGRKTGSDAAQYFNVVGYVYKNEKRAGDDRIVEHRILLDGPKKYLTKSCSPLGGTLDTNIAEWLRLVRAST